VIAWRENEKAGGNWQAGSDYKMNAKLSPHFCFQNFSFCPSEDYGQKIACEKSATA
jgi:hypothetical protein